MLSLVAGKLYIRQIICFRIRIKIVDLLLSLHRSYVRDEVF